MMGRRAGLMAAMGALAILVSPGWVLANDALSALKPRISSRYPRARWVTVPALGRALRRPRAERPVLLDTRPPSEFRVSHLKGARRVSPDISNFDRLGLEQGQEIVVYCSVGWRSGRVAQAMSDAGYTNVRNLEGGLFAWANEGLPLYRGRRRVSVVHPYDEEWGRMLDARFHPRR